MTILVKILLYLSAGHDIVEMDSYELGTIMNEPMA